MAKVSPSYGGLAIGVAKLTVALFSEITVDLILRQQLNKGPEVNSRINSPKYRGIMSFSCSKVNSETSKQ